MLADRLSGWPMRGEPRHGVGVLVVDDDRLVIWTLEECMRGLGYFACRAPNAAEALRILKSRPEIRLLVTEIDLWPIDGHDLITAARKIRPDLGVIIVTGDAHGIRSHDVFPVIVKPFHPRQLEQAVLCVLAASGGAQAIVAQR